jgi:hypothetical protein
MKIKTSELKDAFLDWAVGKCEYMRHSLESDFCGRVGYAWEYSTDWAQGGPIIERECIDLQYQGGDVDVWAADIFGADCSVYGDTPLIAAMRCYVSSKLGDEVDVPEELQ